MENSLLPVDLYKMEKNHGGHGFLSGVAITEKVLNVFFIMKCGVSCQWFWKWAREEVTTITELCTRYMYLFCSQLLFTYRYFILMSNRSKMILKRNHLLSVSIAIFWFPDAHQCRCKTVFHCWPILLSVNSFFFLQKFLSFYSFL